MLGRSRVYGILDVKVETEPFSIASFETNFDKHHEMLVGGAERRLDGLDAVVLALGAKGMRSVIGGSPDLAASAPELERAASLGGIDVVACRLWLDKYVPTREPANVFSRFDSLRGAGGTFFMLDQLQKRTERELWAGEEPQGSVLACDFYGADRLIAELPEDGDIVALLTEELLPAAVPEFRGAKVLDAHVRRYPGAVSWFSPGTSVSKTKPALYYRVYTPLIWIACAIYPNVNVIGRINKL